MVSLIGECPSPPSQLNETVSRPASPEVDTEGDGYTLWEAPDNVSMAAVALAIGSGGALSSFDTTVLLTVDETLDALRKAGQIQYRAPGS